MKHVPIAISFRLALPIATDKGPRAAGTRRLNRRPWLWDVNVTAFSALSMILVVGILLECDGSPSKVALARLPSGSEKTFGYPRHAPSLVTASGGLSD